jgi:hypothetical protein
MLAIFAGLVGVIACVATGGRITSAILGGLMLAVATHQAPMTTSLMEAPGDVATWPQHDLTKAPLPDDAKGYVRLEGFLRPTMQLREFQVPQGDRPNQNEVAHAVLMPLVGTSAGVIKIEGRTVIARVPEKLRRGPERVQLAGALVAPPLGVTEVLIKLGHEGEEQKQVRAIMLDTTRTGYDEQPWVTAIIVGLTLLFATGQLWPRKRDED